jgi:hexokinase
VQINDTVGTLAAGHYWNDDVMIGMILGTVTNACYVEGNLPNDIQTKSGKMVNILFHTFRPVRSYSRILRSYASQ